MAAPTVTSVTPSTGTVAGGTTCLIAGTGLDTVTAVYFGAVSADFEVSSATLLAATSPPNVTGAVTVTVTNPDGSSTDAVDFTYSSAGMFTVAEARAYDRGQLKDTAVYSSVAITAKELEIRTRFQDIIGVRLSPTSITEYLDGDGSETLYLGEHNPFAERPARPVTLTSVTVIATDGTETAYSAAELADVVKYPYKLVRHSGVFVRGYANIKVVYAVGYTSAPADIKGAALEAIVLTQPDGLVPNLSDSSAYEGDENGIRWSRVKDDARGRWFGHENVDAVLRRHRSIETLPGIA